MDIFDYIDQLSATYNSLLPMSPENQRRWDKKVRLEFNYNSNHIEGNTLTYGETELLLLFDETHGNRPMRDYEEMKGLPIPRLLLPNRTLKTSTKLFWYSLFGKTLLPPMGNPPADK